MASIWRRLHVTRYFVRSCVRGRQCHSKLAEIVTRKDTIHPLATALKLVALLTRNCRRSFTLIRKIHTIRLNKNQFNVVKSVGTIKCKNLTVDDLQQYTFYFYVLRSISIVLFRRFRVWFSSFGMPSGSVYVLLLSEPGKLR